MSYREDGGYHREEGGCHRKEGGCHIGWREGVIKGGGRGVI